MARRSARHDSAVAEQQPAVAAVMMLRRIRYISDTCGVHGDRGAVFGVHLHFSSVTEALGRLGSKSDSCRAALLGVTWAVVFSFGCLEIS